MAKLTRYTQQVFGSAAGNNQMAEYGSFIASPPGNLYNGSTITPSIVQGLPNYSEGLYGSVGGAYSPTIQDQNSLFYVQSYQTAYLFQQGIADWDAETIYYTNSYVQVSGIIYVSLQENNTNNPPGSSPSYWSYPLVISNDLTVNNPVNNTTTTFQLSAAATLNQIIVLPLNPPAINGMTFCGNPDNSTIWVDRQQTGFFALINDSVFAALPATGYLVVPFNILNNYGNYTLGTGWNNATNTFTAPSTGQYKYSVNFTFSNTTFASGTRLNFFPVINGSSANSYTWTQTIMQGTSRYNGIAGHIDGTISLSATDQLQFGCYADVSGVNTAGTGEFFQGTLSIDWNF